MTLDIAVTTDSDDEIRSIEAAAAPTRFARGWHCLGIADSFRDGTPHSVHAFGTKLVVFADSSGDLKVLDAYCRHMGGDLSQGSIKGDSVACPFHDWRWGGDGRCTGIPYARRVPLRARTRGWRTLERNGQLFVWHDPQGNTPPAEVTIPEIEGLEAGEWTQWTWNALTVTGSHCREIIDNNVDMAHFFYIHKSFPRFFKNVFEGHISAQYMESTPREDVMSPSSHGDPNSHLRSEAAYYGPSYMIDRLWIEANGATVETVLVNSHYPVDNNSFVLQYGAIVKKLPGMSEAESAAMAEKFVEGVESGFLQDVEIWKNKAPIDNPLLCEEDGPVYQLRRWYEQFYVDVEDVAEDMTRRFEFEIDTTRAVASWEREVAANLAKRDDAERVL
ncbi:Rieske 2Fe-2S domain-containing protein [Speluncibacter jeojiensis]|uniref:Rieske 2Fe-2S domain-containing protein n=1 Tax=Speluncibacter jeojiensis TaxID=2710754 RepID=UPI002FCC4B3F